MELFGIEIEDVLAAALLSVFLMTTGWVGGKVVRGWFKPKSPG